MAAALSACCAPCTCRDGDRAPAAPTAALPRWLEGRVVDARGQPVADVPVAIHGGIATRWKIGETTTDDDGRFAFAERVEGASMLADGSEDYVGVCAGRTVDNANPAAYLPWIDVRIPAGGTGTCTLVLDERDVARKLRALRER